MTIFSAGITIDSMVIDEHGMDSFRLGVQVATGIEVRPCESGDKNILAFHLLNNN